MATVTQVTQNFEKLPLFQHLKKTFSRDVVIQDTGRGLLKTLDVDGIQSMGALQSNSLVDRFSKIYTTSGLGLYNNFNSYNFQQLRTQLYVDYEAMDQDAIISTCLDIYTEECQLKNSKGEILEISSDNEDIYNHLHNLFYDVLNIDFNLYYWIRNLCKYGDFFLKLEIMEKLGIYNIIPFSPYGIVREEGFDRKRPNAVRFKFDPTHIQGLSSGYGISAPYPYASRETIYFENYEMVHLRLNADVNYLPYGKAIIENARPLYKMYRLLEDATVIHRISRAPDRRIFYHNVGNTPANEIEGIMQKMKNALKRVPFVDPNSGMINEKYFQETVLDDFYIPVRGSDPGTKIDTLAGLKFDGIQDVIYFREKLFAALKVPKAFMGYEKDLSGKSVLASQDMRFAHAIERVQKNVEKGLKKIAEIHLVSLGFPDEELGNFKLNLTNSSIVFQQEQVAAMKERVGLAKDMMETGLFSSDKIYKDFFKMSDNEVDKERKMVKWDMKRSFENKQIEEEYNDPTETNQVYGTPAQLANLYSSNNKKANVPSGYDPRHPEEGYPLPGRPQTNRSFVYTDDSTLGRDRTGRDGMHDKADLSVKHNYMGDRPVAIHEEDNMENSAKKVNALLTENFKTSVMDQLISEEVKKKSVDIEVKGITDILGVNNYTEKNNKVKDLLNESWNDFRKVLHEKKNMTVHEVQKDEESKPGEDLDKGIIDIDSIIKQ